MWKQINHSRKLVSDQDFFIASRGWIAVGLALWYHPNAPTGMYFTTDQVLEDVEKYGRGSAETSEVLVAMIYGALRNIVKAPFYKRWQHIKRGKTVIKTVESLQKDGFL